MGTTNYVSLSLATALERSLDLAAHNMANASTAGFKASQPLLEAVDPTNSGDDTQAVNYVQDKGIYVDMSQGTFVPTGNPLDVAVNGEFFFGYEAPGGETAYGRDGRLTLNTDGQLVTMGGSPVVDISGAAITIPAETGTQVTIANDGTITDRDGGTVGRIGLFSVDNPSLLEPIGNGLFLAGGTQAEQTENGTISQGFIEQSNVQPVVEMINLMDIQRAYERAVQLMRDENDLTKQAIERLGRVL